MVRSNTQALAAARKTTKNVPGTCQLKTRTWFDAPSAGDRDHDGDADANDGWLSEPISARVLGDRNPPPGAPLYFANADGTGFGHRCIATGKGSGARSTDMLNGRYSKGNTSDCTIEQLERSMGLKYKGWSRTITGIPIPGLEKKAPVKPAPKPSKPKPPVKKPPRLRKGEVLVRAGHLSMQFSDSLAHRKADAEKIFDVAVKAGYWWLTGTEALEADTRKVLSAAAKKHGFWIYFGEGTDAWAAVNRKVAKPGSLKGFTGPTVVAGKKGKHAAKKTVRVDFDNVDLGPLSVFPVHNVLGVDPANQKRHMAAVGRAAARAAAAGRLPFMGADGNVQDARFDPAFGNGFISCWDDLKKYPSTGHGTIDYIFRWAKSKRVRILNAVSRSDRKLPLHSDHFAIAAAYAVSKLKR